MSSEYKTLIYEKKNNVAWITLNRPEVFNAQSDELRAELVNAIEEAGKDDEEAVETEESFYPEEDNGIQEKTPSASASSQQFFKNDMEE